MVGRAVFQMGQAESENQILYRYQQERCYDADLDCTMRLPDAGLYQVSVEVKEKHAANPSLVAAQSIRKTGPDGLATRRSPAQSSTQHQSNGFAVKVNRTAVM